MTDTVINEKPATKARKTTANIYADLVELQKAIPTNSTVSANLMQTQVSV